MTDDDDHSEAAFEHVFGALFATGLEGAKLLAGATGTGAALTGAGVVAYALGATVGKGVYRVFTGRRASFANGYLRAFDGDADSASSNANSPTAADAMYHAFRHMMDAVDECVVEPLGMLAGMYTYQKLGPDRFFRGLGRTLCELEAREFGALKLLLAHVVDKSTTSFRDEVISTQRATRVSPQGPTCFAPHFA
jgi:hypothetical protein